MNIKRILLSFLIFCTLSTGISVSETDAHEIIPDDIMNAILENPYITDEEIDQMFLDRYGMSAEAYTEQQEIAEEEGIRQSLEGDPEYDAYLQRQYEENEALRKNQNLTQLKNNINFNDPENLSIFEAAQKKELSLLLELRTQLKEGGNTIASIQNAIFSGILHIWGGLDHILFFLTLLLVIRPFREILLIISVFTLAHSITLFLVGSGAIMVSSKIVEIIIALSIVYSAVFAGIQILHSRGLLHTSAARNTDFTHTLILVFVFGLFHGMGFAEVFDNFDIPFTQYWISLLLYNGGIEIGQIILLAIFFPLIYWIYKKNWESYIIVPSSFIIATFAVIWVFERI